MGCIEVLRSMRSLDFSTRTQVTREAITRLHEAVPGVRGSWKKKAPNKALASILGKSNLRFAGMSIAVSISIDGLNLSVPATRQIIANHHMQSISFASGGDTDMADYVAYVAKDPINQRACHILECCEGLAQSVISTVGQAFELRFKQYLHSPPKVVLPPERLTGLEDSAWGDEEELEHNYYNSIPGKEPPLGGLVDSRLALTQPCPLGTPGALGQAAPPARRDTRGLQWDMGPSAPAPPGDGYVQADARGSRDYEDHLYVNTQGLDGPEPLQPEDSPQRDLFDMRARSVLPSSEGPFEDALRLHECSVVAAGTAAAPLPVEDQWPSPPTRRAPIAPTEEQLRQEPWYHGQMSRRAAEKLLRADGDFLVRDSVTNPGQYVLTGMHAGQPKHLLLVDPEGVVRTKDALFESISHLVDYHLQHGQPIVAAGSELHLRGAVKREP
nr:SHC-transforming protein 2 isoform X3 [Vicugna pacos]